MEMDEFSDPELDDTIGFIAEALTWQQGFQVSDNDHAKEILDWLVELKERRAKERRALVH